MTDLEKSKERLKNSLIRLENAINNKIAKLELEAHLLREQVLQLKQDKAIPPTGPKRAKKEEPHIDFRGEQPLVGNKASSEIDLSLKELRKLLG